MEYCDVKNATELVVAGEPNRIPKAGIHGVN